MKQVITANVPCNGCTSCCRNDLVFIHPECGDVASEYLTMTMRHPITKAVEQALQHDKNTGSCIYLGETGCTIHERRPSMCREFDCRRFFLGFKDRAERRRAVRSGMISNDVLKAGQARLHTLPDPTG